MIRSGHLLRDTVLLTLPLVVFMGYVVVSMLVSIYNTEIVNFHGYPVRSLRISGPQGMFQQILEPLWAPVQRRFIPDVPKQASKLRVFNLWIDGNDLKALESALPASAKVWQPALLMEEKGAVQIKVRNRGQRFNNFIFRHKAWKIKTRKRSLIDGYRVINLVPAEHRLSSYLAIFVSHKVGLPTPRARFVRLYINREDQGLYVQEEQIDESMLRRVGYMPGDMFYGEIFSPAEPKMSSKDLFWNPYLWEKHDRNNRYTEEFRPYLGQLLDLISNNHHDAYNRIQQLLDQEVFPLYFALLTFIGDIHVDNFHNHKLYFDPLSGKFVPFVWNALMNMPNSHGVESMANRFFRKLVRDPRFLDQVQYLVWKKMVKPDFTQQMVKELDRILRELAGESIFQERLAQQVRQMKDVVLARGQTVRQHLERAEVEYVTDPMKSGSVLRVFATAAASLLIKEFILDVPAKDFRVFEDRDKNSELSTGDREIQTRAVENHLEVKGNGVRLFVGRDFRVSYSRAQDKEGIKNFQIHRNYTRLAALESRFLFVSKTSSETPQIVDLVVEKTVGGGSVEIKRGYPSGLVATESMHPWSISERPVSVEHHYSGTVELRKDLVVAPQDTFKAAPDTIFRMGPGVSLIFKRRVHLNKLRFERLDPDRAWGVIALQGKHTSDSILENLYVSGGSEDTIDFIYYSGMLSVHYADRVIVRNSVFSKNIMGDDTLRFAKARELQIRDVKVINAGGDAIDFDISTGIVQGLRIISPVNDGLDLMTSNVELRDIEIHGAGDKGISFGESSSPKVSNVKIVGSDIGIAIKDTSNPVLRDVTIRDSRIGVSGYDKNWHYEGGGRGRFMDCVLQSNDIDVSLDKASVLILERCRSGGRYVTHGSTETPQIQEIDAFKANTIL